MVLILSGKTGINFVPAVRAAQVEQAIVIQFGLSAARAYVTDFYAAGLFSLILFPL